MKDLYTAVVKMLDSGDKLKIDQEHLETVIPGLGKRTTCIFASDVIMLYTPIKNILFTHETSLSLTNCYVSHSIEMKEMRSKNKNLSKKKTVFC